MANEIKLKLQFIKDKIAGQNDSLYPVNTGKLRTGQDFNSDKSHEITSEKNVAGSPYGSSGQGICQVLGYI